MVMGIVRMTVNAVSAFMTTLRLLEIIEAKASIISDKTFRPMSAVSRAWRNSMSASSRRASSSCTAGTLTSRSRTPLEASSTSAK